MAFENATATGPADLLAKFRTFITTHPDLLDPAGDSSIPSHAWTILKQVVDGDDEELYLSGPGNNADQTIYVNTAFGPDAAAGSDAFSWDTRGATAFNTNDTFVAQPGIDPNSKVMPLQDQAVQYWFFANGRRYIIIAQVTVSVYTSTYAGFISPFEPVSAALAYPYPLYIGASMGQLGLRFSSESNALHRSFWNPAFNTTTTGSAAVFSSGNVWKGLANFVSNGTNEADLAVPPLVGGTEPYSNANGVGAFQVDNVEPLLGGDYLLTDVEVSFGDKDVGNYRERFGVLDGVAHLTGISQAVLNEVTIGGDTYIVFQEAFRTGQGNFVAIKK
ncbi:MAG: hypothetical protein JKX78_03805 [Alteromonadaceae bacterium]|nr:hypothetical protein [Alteromonadaceae bacterium]MBL4909078.1 hypothetical protein [Alteromonadaceae bacterium]MBL4909144.1 hypothetical protein [Alteromonadaceae bacterium]